MSIHRHPSFFPAVVVLLTVLLAGGMFAVFQRRSAAPVPEPVPAVNQETYHAAAKGVLASIVREAPAFKVADVDAALAGLLALRVPPEDRDAHLAFALALSRLSAGLKGDAGALKDGRSQWDAAVAAQPWVR